jgi:pimeloyl-ACP methyl ester carboxylesterase
MLARRYATRRAGSGPRVTPTDGFAMSGPEREKVPEARPVELSAGPIAYEDTGGDGPAIVLIHGLLMDSSLWEGVTSDLRRDFRCIRPTLPLGAHRDAMHRDADLSLRGQARIVAEFLDRLQLDGVTLVFNDWCAAQVIVAEGWHGRIARLVLASCETYDNYPPGLPGRVVALAARVPGGLAAALKPLRLRPLRRLPLTFGLMSKRAVPDEVMDRWLEPATRAREIRRDVRKYAGDARRGRRVLVAANDALPDFSKPVLVAWGAQDRVMPLAAGRALADSFPNSRFVEIADSRTLIPIDQPQALAGTIAEFVRTS